MKPEELSRIKRDEYFRGSKEASERINSGLTKEREERKEFIRNLRVVCLANPRRELVDLLIAMDK